LQAEAESATTERATLLILKELAIKVGHLKIAPTEVRDNANLFDDCGLDSASVVDMVFDIEDAFGITIPEEEIDAELFQNVGKLAEFVDAKRAGVSAG
jgi:acyl carrier protein